MSLLVTLQEPPRIEITWVSMSLPDVTTPGTFVNQTFTGTNGTAPGNLIVGKNPTAGGGVTIQTNRVDFATGTAGGYVFADKVSRTVSEDGTTPLLAADVQIDCTVNFSTDEIYPEVAVRATQATNYDGQTSYFIELKRPSSVFTIVKAVSYTYTTLATTAFTYTASTDYQVRLRISGPTIQAWIGTTLPTSPTLTATDTAITAPGYVVFSYGGGGSAVSGHNFVDNLLVTDATMPPPYVVAPRR